MMETLEPFVSERIQQWLEGNYDQDTKKKLQQLQDQKAYQQLTDAFYKDLEFGTGGLRGIMGIGTNRINQYTIGMATQGLSNYLKKVYPDEQIKVAIAHDNRNNAEFFASITAEVFSANDIHVYFFDGLRPTPELSFAIRELHCHSGVMLTASHNPKEYSGYKAYWKGGGQVVAPHDKLIIEEVNKIQNIDQVSFDRNSDLIEVIGDEMDRIYLQKLKQLSLSGEAIQHQHDLKIVFSPIHGTGITLVPRALQEFGFTNVNLVEEQCTTDGNFPTVVYPNPEEVEALEMALEKARKIDADLVMATDPDGDRVGIAVKNEQNEFVLLNGNQTGSLLIYYLLNAWEARGKLKGSEYIVKTIVTSYLLDKIAASKRVDCYNVLTGFKYIGDLMNQFGEQKTFIAGGEESYGYLAGEHARDKDAVIACAMIAEMTAYYKDQGKSLYEVMLEMYVEYDFYKEKLISITKEGKSGAEEIRQMMKTYRESPPKTLGGSQVLMVKDYLNGKTTDLRAATSEKLLFPVSDVLQFITEDGSIISARPSGTEPKIKFYCSVNTSMPDKASFADLNAKMEIKIEQILKDLM